MSSSSDATMRSSQAAETHDSSVTSQLDPGDYFQHEKCTDLFPLYYALELAGRHNSTELYPANDYSSDVASNDLHSKQGDTVAKAGTGGDRGLSETVSSAASPVTPAAAGVSSADEELSAFKSASALLIDRIAYHGQPDKGTGKTSLPPLPCGQPLSITIYPLVNGQNLSQKLVQQSNNTFLDAMTRSFDISPLLGRVEYLEYDSNCARRLPEPTREWAQDSIRVMSDSAKIALKSRNLSRETVSTMQALAKRLGVPMSLVAGLETHRPEDGQGTWLDCHGTLIIKGSVYDICRSLPRCIEPSSVEPAFRFECHLVPSLISRSGQEEKFYTDQPYHDDGHDAQKLATTLASLRSTLDSHAAQGGYSVAPHVIKYADKPGRQSVIEVFKTKMRELGQTETDYCIVRDRPETLAAEEPMGSPHNQGM